MNTPLKVYVATRMREDAASAMQQVRDAGMVVSHDWTNGPRSSPDTGPGIAEEDIEAIRGSDAVLLVWWPGMTGAYTELGAALVLGVPVVVAGADVRDNVFLYHRLVTRVETVRDAVWCLIRMSKGNM